MPKLYITCPKTALLIDTGLSMDAADFAYSATIFRFSELNCPYCGDIHRYDKPDIHMETDATAISEAN
jgi:hypothetical protein